MTLPDSRALLAVAVAAAALMPAPTMAGDADKPAAKSASFVDDFDGFDRSRWYVSDGWSNGPHQNCTWSKHELKVTKGVLELHFDKKAFKDRDYSCAELHTRKHYSYGTYEARMKTDAGPGLNAAFFTYVGANEKKPHDEIDFEVLTKNPKKVQLNVFASGKGKNEKLVDVKGGSDKAYHDYAFIWEPKRLRWYVDGTLVNTITDPAKIPSHAQNIFFSLWGSDTLSDWMGKFEDPGRQLTLKVDRVAYTALGDKCQFEGSLACGQE